MLEYVEFHNPTAVPREASLVFDLRSLPSELAVTFMLSSSARALPGSVSGIEGTRPASLEDPPVPSGFEPLVYKAARSVLVEVPEVVLPPYEHCAALLRVENTGILPKGSRYTFEVQQHRKANSQVERLTAETLLGGSTYIVRIEGEPPARRPEATPGHEAEGSEEEVDRLDGMQGYVPPWVMDTMVRRQIEQGRRLAEADRAVFVHRVDGDNRAKNSTIIRHPLTDQNPDALLLVTPNWNPAGSDHGVYDDHPIGVWYDATTAGWAIFNQDMAVMPDGAAFNVNVLADSELAFVHRATAGSISGNSTIIDSPFTNGNPGALLLVTSNWNPGGAGGVYDDHPTGVWYDGSSERWAVFNQDLSAIPVGAGFNVNVVLRSDAVFVHRAAAESVSGNSTFIDHPSTNARPDAVLLITPNWSPDGVGDVYNNHATGVWYDTASQRWAVFNQDQAVMPEGAAFNVLSIQVGPAGV